MDSSLSVLILEKDHVTRQALETIFSFLKLSCQSGELNDCLSYLDSASESIDVCIIGCCGSQCGSLDLMKRYPDQAFITLASCEQQPDDRNAPPNFIGALNNEPTYDELISLIHYCQSFRAMKKFSEKAVTGNQLIKLLVGKSIDIVEVRRLIEQVAPKDANVLILGESGTGKEVVARAIHELSLRSKKPFVPVNCGAIPGELLESELFGHEKGAFTGAFSTREGRFELAQGGTLFLDEIGDMPYAMQVKLLRVLEERRFTRVGSNREIEADVRIIAATHQNLEKMVSENKFREDLYYRLNVFPIVTPPLTERRDDIPLLIQELVNRHGTKAHCSIRFTSAAMQTLMQLNDWHGNVRELSNLVERLLILHPNEVIDIKDLPEKYRGRQRVKGTEADERDALLDAFVSEENFMQGASGDDDGDGRELPPVTLPPLPVIEGEDDLARAFMPTLPMEGVNLKDMISDIEISMIRQALNQSNGVVAKAAEALGLRRTTLIEKMKKYGIPSQG